MRARPTRGVLQARAMLLGSAHVLARVAEQEAERVEELARLFARTLKAGGAVYFCGNGGSAADSQHLAAELCGRFYRDRAPLRVAALTTNSSALTALANDYSFDQVFERQVRAYGRRGDVLVGISTSGRSPNVRAALKAARRLGMVTVGLTGVRGRALGRWCDHLLVVPSEDVARIQEGHILLGHVICARTEALLFPRR
ncbi:MAG TPA: D-sedoheptulose 7-phosphate isomerase [Candidatus Saccharimonadales bacterium]|nr:D-sedoheptulose 7-phosphate isomerase [Candidatus Saccharimonadales bacterium]